MSQPPYRSCFCSECLDSIPPMISQGQTDCDSSRFQPAPASSYHIQVGQPASGPQQNCLRSKKTHVSWESATKRRKSESKINVNWQTRSHILAMVKTTRSVDLCHFDNASASHAFRVRTGARSRSTAYLDNVSNGGVHKQRILEMAETYQLGMV